MAPFFSYPAAPPETYSFLVWPHHPNELLLGVAKEHESEVLVDGVDRPVWVEGDHTADVGEDPHHTAVHLDFIVLVIGYTAQVR